jgi:hypothetical protein
VRAVVDWWARRGGGGDGGDGGRDGGRDGGAEHARALDLLRALAAEVAAQEEGLRSAHVAFVRRGECVAVRREHAERVLRRLGADPEPVMAAWRQAAWLRAAGDPLTAPIRAPWGARPRMLVLEWDAARPEDGAARGRR